MTPTASTPSQVVVLSPSYNLPLFLAIAAVPLLFLQIWLGLLVFLFAMFLLFQAATLRLHFTETALDIYRSEKLIRHFPYADWLNWQVFWPVVPILFYFKEVKSIHFLPILFDPKSLQACLEDHCPRLHSDLNVPPSF
jgi:hypothetical protein